MEDIVFPKRYRSKITGNVVEFTSLNEGTIVDRGTSGYDIGYSHDRWIDCTDTSTWGPVEEEHTVSEKEPFPAFEDIEWVMVEAPKGVTSINGMTLLEEKLDCSNGAYRAEVEVARILHENSKDFKVSWELKKEKPKFKVGEWVENVDGKVDIVEAGDIFNQTRWKQINRKLHENRPLAIAVGKWLVETGECIDLEEKTDEDNYVLIGVSGDFVVMGYYLNRDNYKDWRYELIGRATLPDTFDLSQVIEQYRIELEKVRRNG